MSGIYRVLVTGGAGYLGSILVPALLNAGHHVTVLDNFMYRQLSLADVAHENRFDVVRGDCRDQSTILPLLRDADVVVPLAALVGAPLCERDTIGAITTNRDSVATMCRLMARDQRLLIPITNSGYGIGDKGKFCTEDSPLKPISLYGTTKVEAERIALARDNTISFRLATVFGMAPRMRLDLLVNDFVHRAVNDRALVLFEPHFKRNYIHVRDVAKVFLHGLDNFETMRGRPYNVGLSDANLSKWELCEKIRAHVPGFVFLEAPIGEDPDRRDYMVSNARVEATGFRPGFGIDSGIRELIKGYRMLQNTVYGNI